MTSENVAAARWQYVRTDEWMALHKIAQQAREAAQIAEELGIYLGPLRAALEPTPYRVEGDLGWRTDEDAGLVPATRED